jgi:hypothetical protein
MSCSCAHFQQRQHHYLAEAVGVSMAPSPHAVSGSLHIFGAAPRRGSEMMQWAFSRTVGNLSFSLSFSTRHTYSVVLDLLDRVSPCSEFVDHMDLTLKITVQTRHTAVYFGLQ